MKKKSVSILKLFISLVILLGIVCFIIDFNRTQINLEPLFVIHTLYAQDGGSAVYYCFGYKVIKYVNYDFPQRKSNIVNMKIGTLFMKFDKENPF